MTENSFPSGFRKKEVRLPDGRRLIYYDFSEKTLETPQVETIQPRERKER